MTEWESGQGSGQGLETAERTALVEAQQARAEALQVFTEGAAPRRGGRVGVILPRGGSAERCLVERESLEAELGGARATAEEVARLELALARCGLRLRRAAW